MKKRGICINCRREILIHGRKMCVTCYKKLFWKAKLSICKRCKRYIKIHAKGLCPGCYNYVFHLDKTKAHQNKKLYNIDDKTYKKITKSCVICGFDKVVELHHLDHDHKNNSEDNLVGICSNHHKMIHNFALRKEVLAQLNLILKSKKQQTTLTFTQETEAPTIQLLTLPIKNKLNMANAC